MAYLKTLQEAISVRLGDWLLATTATAAPLLVVPAASSPTALVIPGVLLVVLGTCFQLWSKLVLRRSFGIAPANRGVKMGGPYRLVRHPMYAGYLAAHVEPTIAESPLYPRRAMLSGLVGLFLLLGWGVALLVYYNVRDNR